MNKPLNSKKIFFIIAPDRSGTSLMQEIMNTFENFCNREESRISGGASPSCWEYVIRLNDFSFLEKFIEKNWTREFFVEKSPPSIECLPQITNKFPNSNFIFLKRNPLKIILSQLNLFYGISEIGKRKNDLDNLLIKKESAILKLERQMAKRLLKMIQNQITYKPFFKNKVEIKYEELTESPVSSLKLIETTFNVKSNQKKALEQLAKPSYSSTFRYGLKDLNDKVARDIIKFASKLWEY